MIYSKKYIFGLCPHFWHRELLKPLEFSKSDKAVFRYVNDVIFRKHPRMGLVTRGINHMIIGLELALPPPVASGEGRGA